MFAPLLGTLHRLYGDGPLLRGRAGRRQETRIERFLQAGAPVVEGSADRGATGPGLWTRMPDERLLEPSPGVGRPGIGRPGNVRRRVRREGT